MNRKKRRTALQLSFSHYLIIFNILTLSLRLKCYHKSLCDRSVILYYLVAVRIALASAVTVYTTVAGVPVPLASVAVKVVVPVPA